MRRRDDTPVDLEPIDVTDDASVVDDGAEDLALSGPNDDAREVTPEVEQGCRECGGRLAQIERHWPAPANPDDAWNSWHDGCVATPSGSWSWCNQTGILWVGDERKDFERRKNPPRWNGEERRKSFEMPTPRRWI